MFGFIHIVHAPIRTSCFLFHSSHSCFTSLNHCHHVVIMSFSILDVEMTKDTRYILHQTIMNVAIKLASVSSMKRRQRTQHRSYIDWYHKATHGRLIQLTTRTSTLCSNFVEGTTCEGVSSFRSCKGWVSTSISLLGRNYSGLFPHQKCNDALR